MTIQLAARELPAYRTSVIACSRPEEREQCERLLGQLASLEARSGAATLTFVPPAATGKLAWRALAHLRAEPRRP